MLLESLCAKRGRKIGIFILIYGNVLNCHFAFHTQNAIRRGMHKYMCTYCHRIWPNNLNHMRSNFECTHTHMQTKTCFKPWPPFTCIRVYAHKGLEKLLTRVCLYGVCVYVSTSTRRIFHSQIAAVVTTESYTNDIHSIAWTFTEEFAQNTQIPINETESQKCSSANFEFYGGRTQQTI